MQGGPAIRASMERAVALHKQGRLSEAEALYREVLKRRPLDSNVLNLLGLLCTQKGEAEEAIELMGRALKVSPNDVNGRFNYGRALQEAGRLVEALENYERALKLRPDWPEALNNRGNVLERLRRREEALASYDRALQLRPDYVAALNNRGGVLRRLGLIDETVSNYRRLLEIAPDCPYVLGWLLYARLLACDWTDYDKLVGEVDAGVEQGRFVSQPQPFLAWSCSAALQHRCARSYMDDEYPALNGGAWTGPRYDHARIRVAWLSDGFRTSVEGETTVALMEQQDRSRIETYGLSLSVDDKSPLRARMKAAFEHFVDIAQMSDREVVQWLRRHEIDIVVAVAVYAGDWRLGILTGRGAPIQVNFGGVGTLGTAAVDYVIADPHCIPESCDGFYSEHVARLAAPLLSYYAPPQIGTARPSRTEVGLPQAGLVFCGFNASYKIQPGIFDVWMRLLREFDDSVLWLRADSPLASANLRKEAERRGVSPSRLVFAGRVPLEEHLSRYRAADLFLDSFPYCAQTTACEALAAGLPLVTCGSDTTASRIAGGLVTAAGLPELVTSGLEDYEALVRQLAREPARLAEVRSRLEVNLRRRDPLDAGRYGRQLADAFTTMHDRHRQGLPPESFDVPARD